MMGSPIGLRLLSLLTTLGKRRVIPISFIYFFMKRAIYPFLSLFWDQPLPLKSSLSTRICAFAAQVLRYSLVPHLSYMNVGGRSTHPPPEAPAARPLVLLSDGLSVPSKYSVQLLLIYSLLVLSHTYEIEDPQQ